MAVDLQNMSGVKVVRMLLILLVLKIVDCCHIQRDDFT